MIAAMLQLQSGRRPTMAAVMAHPAWWSAERKLAFLVEISNFVEFQDRQVEVCSSWPVFNSADSLNAKQPARVFADGHHVLDCFLAHLPHVYRSTRAF